MKSVFEAKSEPALLLGDFYQNYASGFCFATCKSGSRWVAIASPRKLATTRNGVLLREDLQLPPDDVWWPLTTAHHTVSPSVARLWDFASAPKRTAFRSPREVCTWWLSVGI